MASMSTKLSQQPFSKRFEHLVGVIGGERFLQMRGLNNDLPFYVCEFSPAEALEMQRLQRQLSNTLEPNAGLVEHSIFDRANALLGTSGPVSDHRPVSCLVTVTP